MIPRAAPFSFKRITHTDSLAGSDSAVMVPILPEVLL